MSLLTEYQLNEAALNYKTERNKFNKTASRILAEDNYFLSSKVYDIFLSHSSLDLDKILGIKYIIESLGFSLYIDRIEDPQLERENVTRETAEQLRMRMKNCKCLFFAISKNATSSKWMPWECGYFDGIKGKVAILPIASSYLEDSGFNGQEYLGLYPYVEKDKVENSNEEKLWITEPEGKYVIFSAWLDGKKPFLHG